MKRIIGIILIVLLMFSQTGCAKTEKKKEQSLVETRVASLSGITKVLDTGINASGDHIILAVNKEGCAVLYVSTDGDTTWQISETSDVTKINQERNKDAIIMYGSMNSKGAVMLCCRENDTYKVYSCMEGNVSSFPLKDGESVYGVKLLNGGSELYVNYGNRLDCYDNKGTVITSYQQKGIIDFMLYKGDLFILGKDGLFVYDHTSGKRSEENLHDTKWKNRLTQLWEVLSSVSDSNTHLFTEDDKENVYLFLEDVIYRYDAEKKSMKMVLKGDQYQISDNAQTFAGYWIKKKDNIHVLLQKEETYDVITYTTEKEQPEAMKEEEENAVSADADPDHPTAVMYQDGSCSLFANYKSSYHAKKKKQKGNLTVYTLYPNAELENEIKVYQKKRPNMKVRLEVGIEKESNIKKEQAVEKLNAKMLSGNGPDILFLDGLSEDYYVKNNMLLELSDIYEEIKKEQELFENFNDCRQTSGHLYSLTTRHIPSVLAGKKETLSKLHSLKDLEELIRKDETTVGNALDIYTPTQLFYCLYPGYSNQFLTEDGIWQEKIFIDFMEQSKKIYQSLRAQTAKNHAQKLWEKMKKEKEKIKANAEKESFVNLRGLTIPDQTGRTIGMATLCHNDSFYDPVMVCHSGADMTYEAIPFGQGEVFETCGVAAINQSADKQLATDFVKELFAPDEQFIYGMTEQSGGMPVNREALRIILSKIHGMLTYDAGEFKENIQNLNIESQQEYDHLLDYLSGLSHAANSEGSLEEIFLEDLDAYMNDDVSLASYEKKVRKKIKLYQSE